MKVKLISNDMWSPALEFTVERFPIVIGRNSNSEIAIDDRWVSAQHCKLNQANGELTVQDLRSKHGTLINGRRVKQSALESGDTLVIGIRSFRVSYRRSPRTAKSSTERSKRHSQADSEAATAAAG